MATMKIMQIELNFHELANLAANGQLEKDGVTITFNRPVLSEVTVSPKGKSGKVAFFLDETDPRVNEQSANAHVWYEFVENDLETYPRDRVPIEVEYENGARAQATFQHAGGGVLSLLNASSEITGGTEPKRWRYLKRP